MIRPKLLLKNYLPAVQTSIHFHRYGHSIYAPLFKVLALKFKYYHPASSDVIVWYISLSGDAFASNGHFLSLFIFPLLYQHDFNIISTINQHFFKLFQHYLKLFQHYFNIMSRIIPIRSEVAWQNCFKVLTVAPKPSNSSGFIPSS